MRRFREGGILQTRHIPSWTHFPKRDVYKRQKLIRVEITRDDTGEKIYETGAIRPGNYVESAPLDAELPAGVYECTAVFFAYGEETEAFIGQAAVKLTLTLQE